MSLAPHSRRTYVCKTAVDETQEEGDQLPTQIGRTKIRLPLSLEDIDRRYLRPVLACEAPRLAAAYPGRTVALRLMEAAQKESHDSDALGLAEYDDDDSEP